MTKTATVQKPMLHESEVQRQHVRIELPATVKIGQQNFYLQNLSAGGFAIKTNKKISADCTEIKILFPFDTFAFHLKVKATPVYQNMQKGFAGYQFIDLTQRQISLISHVIKSYLTGLLTTEQDIIAAVNRDNRLPNRGNENDSDYLNGKLRRSLPLIAVLLSGLFGLFIVLGNVYESKAIVKSYLGKVEGNDFTARATESGTFNSLLTLDTGEVTKGQPIGVIKTAAAAPGFNPATINSNRDTNTFVIYSPCDCLITNRFPNEGEFVAAGDPVYKLQPIDDDLWITASLNPEDIHRLHLQDSATVRIAGESRVFQGTVTRFLPPDFHDGKAKVKIRTEDPIPYFMSGYIAYVELYIN